MVTDDAKRKSKFKQSCGSACNGWIECLVYSGVNQAHINAAFFYVSDKDLFSSEKINGLRWAFETGDVFMFANVT